MRFAVSVLLLAAVPSPAWAATSGNDLYEKCNPVSRNDSSLIAIGYCLGFIEATVSVGEVLLVAADARIKVCRPPSANVGQAAELVVKYLKDNPAERPRPAAVLVVKALQQAWPCPK
jgi:hypothetical protein